MMTRVFGEGLLTDEDGEPGGVATMADPASVPAEPGPAGEGRLTSGQFDFRIHDAILTISNPKTGKHRTFKIETLRGKWHPGERIISLLNGPDNAADYKRFAWIEDGQIRVEAWFTAAGTRFDPGKPGDPPTVWEKYARMIEKPGLFEAKGAVYQIAGKCRRCGRRLTTSRSLMMGIGPDCEGKV